MCVLYINEDSSIILPFTPFLCVDFGINGLLLRDCRLILKLTWQDSPFVSECQYTHYSWLQVLTFEFAPMSYRIFIKWKWNTHIHKKTQIRNNKPKTRECLKIKTKGAVIVKNTKKN